MKKWQLTNCSDKDSMSAVLCDTAGLYSQVSYCISIRLGFHGTIMKLTVKYINTEENIAINLVEVTVTPLESQAHEKL